ncbi:MAG: carboxylate--amine ligase [Sphingorhabdus sp.]
MTALVLGAHSPIGLTLVRELGRHGVAAHVIAGNPRDISGASRYARAIHNRPAGPIGEWLPAIIASTGARGLLAVTESDLVELAALPPIIANCVIATPRQEPLSIVLDKRETLARAKALGLDVPMSWQADGNRPPDFHYPVVLKWADPTAIHSTLETCGVAFRKTEYALNREDLIRALARYDAVGQWPLVQSYAHGIGLGQMLYMHRGRATLRFQHQRLHEWPPEGGVSTLCQAVPLHEHAKQMELSESLLAAIGWEGAAMVEYRYDVGAQRYTLMEINGRFWGSLPLASLCGAEFGWETYRRALLGKTDSLPAPRDDLTARYMLPETRRLLHLWLKRKDIKDPFFKSSPLQDTLDYIVRTADPKLRHYVFSWDDPGPLIRDIVNGVRKLARVRSQR